MGWDGVDAGKKRSAAAEEAVRHATLTHVKVVGVQQLVAEEGNDDLHGKAAAVNKIAVEEVWVVLGGVVGVWAVTVQLGQTCARHTPSRVCTLPHLRGKAVDLENVEHVVKLPVHIAAHGELQGAGGSVEGGGACERQRGRALARTGRAPRSPLAR